MYLIVGNSQNDDGVYLEFKTIAEIIAYCKENNYGETVFVYKKGHYIIDILPFDVEDVEFMLADITEIDYTNSAKQVDINKLHDYLLSAINRYLAENHSDRFLPVDEREYNLETGLPITN